MDGNLTGWLFDIQGFSVHDGSGCRTLVFLGGCPLRCSWCANPEGQLSRPRMMYRSKRCISECYGCVEACPEGAIQVKSGTGQRLLFDRSACDRCDTMDCVQACLSQALQTAGRYYSVDDLMRVLVRDQGFWGSQGGVTFSGGEPLFQAEFLLAVLEKCRSNYIHAAVETSAHADTDLLMEVSKRTDWMFIDIKHMDPAAHQAETGVGNALILRNIEVVAGAEWDGRLIIRLPIVPGFNDTMDNLQATAAFMVEHDLAEVNLLPFHRLGLSKYEQLGLAYKCGQVEPPSSEVMRSHQRVFQSAGLHCYVGSETPF